jgi:hypothetical protein
MNILNLIIYKKEEYKRDERERKKIEKKSVKYNIKKTKTYNINIM